MHERDCLARCRGGLLTKAEDASRFATQGSDHIWAGHARPDGAVSCLRHHSTGLSRPGCTQLCRRYDCHAVYRNKLCPHGWRFSIGGLDLYLREPHIQPLGRILRGLGHDPRLLPDPSREASSTLRSQRLAFFPLFPTSSGCSCSQWELWPSTSEEFGSWRRRTRS